MALDGGGALARAFGDVQLTPTTFVIDKRGRIVASYLGELDSPRLRALRERELAAG